jgi:PAS domain S-box-containing protein
MAKILIVAADRLIKLEIERVLTGLGYELAGTAETGPQAIALAQDLSPDLIIMDATMPGKPNGMETAMKIQSEWNIPIIFISGSGDRKIIEKAKKIGRFGYIMKPFDANEVKSLVEIALYRSTVERKFERVNKKLYDMNLSLQREIENRKRAEEALQRSHEVLSFSQRMARLGSWELDLNTQIITLSKEHQFMAGKAPVKTALPLAEYAADYIVEEDIPVIEERLAVAVQNIENARYQDKFEYRLKTDDVGGYRNLAVEGRFTSKGIISGITRDITERKRSEEALQKSEEKYRLLIENAADAIYIVQDGKLKFANTKGIRMTGYSSKELEAMSFVDIVHPEDSELVLKRHLNRLEGKEEPSIYSFRIIDRSGKVISVELNTVLIAWEDRPATLNFLRDLTSQKKLEARLQQAQKMEAIGTLAGGVAHEFNNALMGIMGAIELLKMDLSENEKRHRYFETMTDSGDRMSRLTGQLLAYARGGKYRAENLLLDTFVTQTLQILQHELKPTIRVETAFPKGTWYIKADPTQLQMVLSAILANANEAMEDEGDIRITAEVKDIKRDFIKQDTSLQLAKYVCLAIGDNGKGMNKETKERIFEPFFTTKFQGRGMGMAAVYGIVKNHDGWIFVESELGKGTVVRIYLPTAEVQITKDMSLRAGFVKGNGTILLIEDEDVVTEVVQAMLERLGYQVVVAKTGKEAIHITETFDGQIDLALLDIKLPDMEGEKLYPLIMKARPNLKVIVSSGFAIEGPAQAILDAGARGLFKNRFP